MQMQSAEAEALRQVEAFLRMTRTRHLTPSGKKSPWADEITKEPETAEYLEVLEMLFHECRDWWKDALGCAFDAIYGKRERLAA